MNRPSYPRTIYTLLCMLSMQPMSGYDIKQALKNMVQSFWSESDGQIYPGLKRCLSDNLIAGYDNNPQQLKHSFKKSYCITDKGREVLNHWLKHNAFKTTQRDEGLLKLTFCNNTHHDTATHIVETRLSYAIEQLNKLNQDLYRESLPEAHASLPYWPHVHDYNKSMLEAEIQWAKSFLNTDLFE